MSTYRVRESGGAGEWIMGAVTRNPEGLLLLAAGAALIMRSGRGQSRRRSYAETVSESARLRECLDELDERRGALIRTAFFEGATYEALAEGIHAATVLRGILAEVG